MWMAKLGKLTERVEEFESLAAVMEVGPQGGWLKGGWPEGEVLI
jgi:hypothetical protein